MEPTKEEIEAKEQQDWKFQKMTAWAKHAEDLASQLQSHFNLRWTVLWENIPAMLGMYSGKLPREILADLQIAVDQLELLSQGKPVTHALVTKAFYIGPDEGEPVAQPAAAKE